MDILANNERTVSNLYCFYERKFLYEIFDETQQKLHRLGKQLPIFMFNDGTQYIRFKKNKNKNEETTVDSAEQKSERITTPDINGITQNELDEMVLELQSIDSK